MGNITRQIRVGLIAILSLAVSAQPVSALDVVPTSPPLIDGPFLITAYSFSGHNLHYLQVANTDSRVQPLDGWKVQSMWDGGMWQTTELQGDVEPNKKVTIANATVMPSATFPFHQDELPSEPRIHELRLVAPSGSGFLDSTVAIAIKDSGSSMTARDSTVSPERFFFSRNVSSSTGNFLSTFTALEAEPASIESDPLYSPVTQSPVQIVEIYPKALDCSPATVSPLCTDYVKIFNASINSVDLSDFRIRTGTNGQSATAANTAYLTGLHASGSYAIVPMNISDSGTFVWVEDKYGLVAYTESIVDAPASTSRQGMAWSYNSESGRWQWTKYPTPSNHPNSFGIDGITNSCAGLKLSEIGANYSPQFIEVYNSTAKRLDISGCQLQTNRSQVASYVFSPSTTLGSGSYLAVPIQKTELSLTKTTTGTVYILSSDGATEVDARSYENLDENTSIALVGGTWRQTFAVTAGNSNQYKAFPPCENGYTRNELTGRCKKDVVTAALAPCKVGQYRNPETNRCRSVSSTTSSLTPCDEGEFRNPETNRCKKLVSSGSTLKPCSQGYERNPDTNRCRKVLSASTGIPSAGFPVEPVADTAKAFTAWWALGGVLLLGLAYAGWEWRYEIRQLIGRIIPRNAS